MIEKIDWMIARKKLALLFKKTYVLERLKKHFIVDECRNTIRSPRFETEIQTRFLFELQPSDACVYMGAEETGDLIDRLEKSVCTNREEELSEVYKRIESVQKGNWYLVKKIPGILKKCAHKKYRYLFELWVKRVKEIEVWSPESYHLIRKQIEELELLAEKRFSL
jgi:hypothetical protein